MLIAFAQTGHPEHTKHFLKSVEGNEIWQITDESGPEIPGCNVFRHPRGEEGFVLWRAKAYAAFNRPALYCDDDMIFQHSFRPLLDLECDVVLTRNDRKIVDVNGVCISDTMHYNGGFALVNNPNYWLHIALKISEMAPEEQLWYGDQIAMTQLANVYQMIAMPCTKYNYTPNKYEDSLVDLSDKWMIHFKGKRKDWMIDYATRMEDK